MGFKVIYLSSPQIGLNPLEKFWIGELPVAQPIHSSRCLFRDPYIRITPLFQRNDRVYTPIDSVERLCTQHLSTTQSQYDCLNCISHEIRDLEIKACNP